MPDLAARRAPPKDDKGPSGPLAIVLACPKCGAPFEADDTVVSVSCTHFRSLLILSGPGRDEMYVADGVTRGAEDIRDTIISYRVNAERAEIIARHTRGEEEASPPAEFWIRMQLESFEKRLRATVQVLDAHRIEAPYWHLTGKLVQPVSGGGGAGPRSAPPRAGEGRPPGPAYAPLKP